MAKTFGIFSMLCLCLSTNPLETVADREVPYFIHRDSVYYLDVRPNYTSGEVQKVCLKENMLFTVSRLDITGILKTLNETYGYIPSVWTYDNHNYGYLMTHNIESTSSCYALSHRHKDFRKENCDEKMGFLCRRMFSAAELFFANGTRQRITSRMDVQSYCNPQSTEFDHVLQLCLIRYFKVQRRTEG